MLAELLREAGVRTSPTFALLPHALLALTSVAAAGEAAARTLRKAGCVEARRSGRLEP